MSAELLWKVAPVWNHIYNSESSLLTTPPGAVSHA